jgi:hypothetical protein
VPIVPWKCALGDAPAATLNVAATVEIAPPDDSVDTNKIIITGTGTISSFGTDAPLVTKDVTFAPAGGSITLVNSLQLALLGGNRTMGGQSFSRFASDGLGHWQEIASASAGFFSSVLYTSSQTITVPAGATKAYVRMTGQGNDNGAAGYLEKHFIGLAPGKTLVLTIGSPTTLASGTQSIGTLTCQSGDTGTASGGDVNVTGFNYSILGGLGYGNTDNPPACLIEWSN